MFKQSVKLEVRKNERDYVLFLPESCNLGELVDVLFEMRTITMNSIQNIIDKEKASIEQNSEQEEKCPHKLSE